MVTREQIEKRIAELEVEADQLERQHLFGLARVRRGDVRYYRQRLDVMLTREVRPVGMILSEWWRWPGIWGDLKGEGSGEQDSRS